MRVRTTIISIVLFLVATAVQGQINIGGNVYGGGNAGNTKGNTKVTVYAGDLHSVFGGARQANVEGSAFLHIDGEHASSYIVIDKAYGGNDISGTIGSVENAKVLPGELTQATENSVTNDWDTFVRVSTKTDDIGKEIDNAQKIYIGQLFGGGNGDYTYASETTGEGPSAVTTYQAKDKVTNEVLASSTATLTSPEIGKAYLEVLGGSIVYAYGGGNNATVTENTVICVDNPSKVVNEIFVDENGQEVAQNGTNILTTDRFRDRMGINTGFSYPSSDAFQIGRFFGGNNMAEMKIRPKWNLKSGKIRNLYSGGNQGNMTSPDGLLLEILAGSSIIVDNVYGGCRMADVHPMINGVDVAPEDIQLPEELGYNFPEGLSARVVIDGGDVNNVYGGNDVTGRVYGGNAVGIRASVRGDVYGGGNGSYPYTDNKAFKDDDIYSDLYYDVNTLLGKNADYAFNGFESAQALKLFRPNAESVSIRVVGTDAKKTIIGGGIYCGGNNATLHSDDPDQDVAAELKIGSYVYADKVFLGNNGANMITEDILKRYADNGTGEGSVGKDFSQMNLAAATKDANEKTQFDYYMDGVMMDIMPRVVFDDVGTYKPYSTYFGSFFCGGNVGSMKFDGAINISFNDKVVIFDKVVGGSNEANVYSTAYNTQYLGGVLGDPDDDGNKLILNFGGLKIEPKRWVDESDKSKLLEWNTISANTGEDVVPVTENSEFDAESDLDRRLKGGNIYGGCYLRGHVEGNVVINLNDSIHDRNKLFDVASDEGDILYENVERGTYNITKRNTGVILSHQGMDVLGAALNVFGGGYGGDSEIWGSTTINLNQGYTFQIFGGGELGAIGKATSSTPDPENPSAAILTYAYDPSYSTYINLNGPAGIPGMPRQLSGDKDKGIAECEFIYGGGFEGKIAGDTHINLGNGRIFNSFAGSCNADVLGHTETYIGRKKKADGTYEDGGGFPWIRDHVYGGNDLGGEISGEASENTDFSGRIRNEVKDMVTDAYKEQVKKPAAYMEYTQGRVRNILGGCFGDYEYTVSEETGDILYEGQAVANKPYMHNAFVNFRPNGNDGNSVEKVFGAGEGCPGDRDGDKGQDHSYVLIDIPDSVSYFANTEVFGAGAYNGLGMRYTAAETLGENPIDINEASAIIDLMRGKISAAYGGSYEEGITRRTVVNVPASSTIKINNIFGGAYGTKILPPCDVYESHVNYHNTDETARVSGAIYGGNNNERRTLYAHVDITAPVWKDKEKDFTAIVYGAGKGLDTWSEYTEVNLHDGAKVYEVYGGGEMGHVLNAESVQRYMQIYKDKPSPDIAEKDELWRQEDRWTGDVGTSDLKPAYATEWAKDWAAAWRISGYYEPNGEYSNYSGNTVTNLNNVETMVREAEMDDRGTPNYKYNTNVIIEEGATVVGYAYGGGYGKTSTPLSGDVYGNTYIALLGGTVTKDLYAAGTAGSVNNQFGADFTASANAYILGGKARNVYGGGWEGSVGYHPGALSTGTAGDQLGETHVVVGKYGVNDFISGCPAVERNVYGGGEGGAVYGTTNVKMMNGYVGYRYDKTSGKYQEKIHDETADDGVGTNRLYESGCVFGGGYVDDSNVDVTNVVMYGGTVRNALFGGGEIAAVGRAVMNNGSPEIYKAGKANVTLWEGHVCRNVFGGGRGYNNLGEIGSLDCDGFVFGQTEVNIFGGEVGTTNGLASGYGNVFGGGDVGYVYGAYQYDNNGEESVGLSMKAGTRYDDGSEGYYYKYENDAFALDGSEKILTEDCKVLIEPHPRVIKDGFQANEQSVSKGEYVETSLLNYLEDKNSDKEMWSRIDSTGIIIHNAVFAGGNTTTGSSLSNAHANTPSVFGNATASINDVYHRDLITLGTGHIGGLYGDGNLTLVDGYRELNITNYGTDYYTIAKEITIEDYKKLPDREAAYYELKYTCLKDCKDKDNNYYYDGNSPEHPKASTITSDDLMAQFLTIQGEGNNKTYVSVKDANEKDILVQDSEGNWIPNTEEGTNYWKQSGVLPVYAGRLMNSIQRADFCGVFGSRMVLQGAQDRVPEIVDYTNYTINRVREVSLNQQHSLIRDDLKLKDESYADPEQTETIDPDDFKNLDKAIHGNYFGIYNIVNYLGALTSDVHFNKPTEGGSPDNRRTDNTNADLYGPEIQRDSDGNIIYESDGVTPKLKGDDLTYYQWKSKHVNDRTRNNGSSFNKVALASGVYLELTSEKSTGKDLYEKDWGYITGVIELDLINVQAGLGGGFVYAKNEHRLASLSGKKQTTLTDLNHDAVTRKWFDYKDATGERVEWETSGNFVHSTQTIIDDCYNISNRYLGNYTPTPDGSDGVPAHYWYIKGSVYVYDQKISAYTGAPNAYSETVEIPLTIAAAAHGTMKLLDVRPNMYAYYSSLGNPLTDEQKLTFGETTYYKNDPISYWDWYMLSKSERDLFVPETMVSVKSYKTNPADADTVKVGKVMLPTDYTTWRNGLPSQKNNAGKANEEIVEHALYDVASQKWVPADEIFRSSNNMSHDTGYILTYKVNNPSKWDTWYTEKSDANNEASKPREKNQIGGDNFEDGPTYHLKSGTGAVLGQKQYKLGDLISHDVETTYQAMGENKPQDNQATFVQAYIVTNPITTSEGILNPGFIIPKAEADLYSGSVKPAYIVTKTIQMDQAEFVTLNTKMTKDEKDALIERAGDNEALKLEIEKNIQLAYYCTSSVTETNKNLYGGRYYVAGTNYRGLEAWSSMSEADRQKFEFNYDAFDLLIDKDYSGTQGQKYQYDAAAATSDAAEANPAHYSLVTPVDYTATYNGTSSLSGFTGTVSVKHSNGQTASVSTIVQGDELVREEYEKLPNEQRHYSGIIVKDGTLVNGNYNVYVVNTSFQYGSTPYAVGTVINTETYNSMSSDEKSYVTKLTFPSGDVNATYYYCREKYTQGTAVTPVTTVGAAVTAVSGGKVKVGTVIASDNYSSLPNMQTNFTIHGISPTETSTLYVSRESDIYNLSKEKIITVIYQYDYEESDTHGNITPVSERHVVNIHVEFRSGVPDVEDILPPSIVLPGSRITTLQDPFVTPGAYEVTGGGWELFQTVQDAESHINGIEYTPVTDLLYYYQNNYYVAYYAQTYLGKTYSNHVPVRVANYHDLKKVMDATTHHYYIDHQGVERDPKIYINDYSESGKNGLDMLKQLFDLSTGATVGDHAALNTSQVGDCKNLDFFMRTDIDHSESAWTPIGTDSHCFEGTLHGDGYTISGLDNSLFHKLCGAVYNLGVTGSFNTAGIVDTGSGYVESCWIKTTGNTPLGDKPFAVFGNPTADAKWKQVVNCYYPKSNAALYSTENCTQGNACMMPDKSFYNGEVAYDLNDFYLNKRYHDQMTTSGDNSYYYFKTNADGTLSKETVDDTQKTKRYQAYYPPKAENKNDYYGDVGYVERRYEDGDFIYANGKIPTEDDERFYVPASETETVTAGYYYPIWPDDYLFFGQRLHYGYGNGQAHQDLPAHINKDKRDGRLLAEEDSVNRVYRAPAYFRSDTMKVAHFNPYAVFAQHKKGDPATIAYQDMTAIDFTGYNDVKYGYLQGWNKWSETSQKLQSSGKSEAAYAFYPPLLDDGGLVGFHNEDLTQNLLAYTAATRNAADVASKTYTVVRGYLTDRECVETNTDYRTVDAENPSGVKGHAVVMVKEKSGSGYTYTTENDHFLVDKNDFNAPIGYIMGSGKRMWYQRTPEDDEFVDRKKGWSAISLPFTAELVTTNDKGEITHFYEGSAVSKNDTKTKIGHEYWLRQYRDITGVEGEVAIQKARMTYPMAADGVTMNKTGENAVTNTFLWDYYYHAASHKDRNQDFYQTYYQNSREYANYNLLTAATPYIIGFPGVTYYEFDLSGEFDAKNTYSPKPAQLDKQTITFASPAGTTIHVSDEEMAGVTYNGYTFKPSYLNEKFKAGTNYYTLHSNFDSDGNGEADCSSYRKVSGEGATSAAFRPYFRFGVAGVRGATRADGSVAQYIIFDDNDSEIKKEQPIQKDDSLEDLIMNGGRKVVVVTSNLHEENEVSIVNVAGITLASFPIQPGQTVKTNIAISGVYIVRTTDGRYTKKVIVY